MVRQGNWRFKLIGILLCSQAQVKYSTAWDAVKSTESSMHTGRIIAATIISSYTQFPCAGTVRKAGICAPGCTSDGAMCDLHYFLQGQLEWNANSVSLSIYIFLFFHESVIHVNLWNFVTQLFRRKWNFLNLPAAQSSLLQYACCVNVKQLFLSSKKKYI